MKKSVGMDLTQGKVLKTLLLFAMPIVLTNLIQQLYSMVDLMVVGHWVGNIGTVGVATGGEIADLATPIAMGFSTAGQIYISQLAGAKDEKRSKETIGTLLTMMLLMSVICSFFTIIFYKPLLNLLNCPIEAMGQASSYMIITAIGLPFVFGYNAVCGILRGLGESKKPMYFIIIAAFINIIADLLFVVVFKWEAAGTAWATILSQFGSFAAAFYYMYVNRDHFEFELNTSYFKINKEHMFVLMKLGIPQVVRSMFVRFSMLWVNSNINSYGIVVSATNSVGNKLNKFLEVFVQGVDAAAGAMVGQNLGAKQHDRAKKVIWTTLGCCLTFATVTSFLAFFFSRQLFKIFTSDAAVIEMSVIYMRIMIMHFYMSAITGTFQSMVTGSGFVSLGFIIGILDGVICRIGFSVLFAFILDMGFKGFWWGTAFARTLPGLLCFVYFISGKWKTRKLLSEKK